MQTMKLVVLFATAGVVSSALCGCGGGGGGHVAPGVSPDRADAHWAGGSRSASGHAIATLPDESFVVLAQLDGSATFGAGAPTQTVRTATGPSDIALARYTADGHLVWAKR